MDFWTTVAIICGIICTPLALFGAYVGIKQLIIWRREKKEKEREAREEKAHRKYVEKTLEELSRRQQGVPLYADGLAEMPGTRRLGLLARGLKAMDEGKYDDAIALFRECLGAGVEESQKTALLILIGNCFFTTDRLDEAIGSYKEAEKVARFAKDNERLANLLATLGLIYHKNKDELKPALEYYRKSSDVYRKIGNPMGEAIELGNMGVVYETQGDLEKALGYYQQALRIFEAIGARLSVAQVKHYISILQRTSSGQ
ncbi:MAG: tetratricopeptide repeat protein [Chloroflexota bacterium]